jgi:hypothetical protein
VFHQKDAASGVEVLVLPQIISSGAIWRSRIDEDTMTVRAFRSNF